MIDTLLKDVSPKLVLSSIGLITIAKYYISFISMKNTISKVFGVVTLIAILACFGAVQQGIFDDWLIKLINYLK